MDEDRFYHYIHTIPERLRVCIIIDPDGYDHQTAQDNVRARVMFRLEAEHGARHGRENEFEFFKDRINYNKNK
jgi:hypothetical protein